MRFGTFFKFFKSLSQIFCCRTLETCYSDICVARFQHLGADASYRNNISDNFKVFRSFPPFPHNSKGDLCTFWSPHFVDCFHQGHIFGEFTIYFHDNVVGLQSEPISWCPFKRSNNSEHPFSDGNFYTYTAETPLGFNLQFLIIVWFQERGMRVKVSQHTADGAIDQLFRGDFFHVVFLDYVESITEQPEVRIYIIIFFFCF